MQATQQLPFLGLKWAPRIKRGALTLGGAAVVVTAWALWYDQTDFLPSPASTWSVAIEVLQQEQTYRDLLATARRLVVGLGLGYVGAFVVALMMRQTRFWRMFFAPYVFITISTPGLAMALISLMVFGLSEVGVYLAVGGVVFPFVVVSLMEGFDHLDAGLSDMAKIYRFSWWQRIRHQALPEMAPYMFAAFRNVHALAWKLVVIAELFSQQTGIGFQYQRAYSYFELERLIIWGVFFIGMVMLVEYGALRPFERIVFSWRRRRAGH